MMKPILISGKLLLDGTGKPAIDGGGVLIEGERIVCVGKTEEIMQRIEGVLDNKPS